MDDHKREKSEDLFQNAIEGDRSAQGRLFEKIRPGLIREARAALNDQRGEPCRPSDLVQDTFASAWKGFHGFQGLNIRAYYAWVSGILQNKTAELRRYWGRERRDRKREEVLAFAGDRDLAPVGTKDSHGP
jgi:DNA-directed RNA polymerase specialized sigma24 family protein